MESDKYFSCLLYSICEGPNSFFYSEIQKKIWAMVRLKPYLSLLLKNDHWQITLELKPRMGQFSLLYADIVLRWNTMISCERQGLETLKAVLKSIFFSFFEKKLHSSKYICPSCRNFNFFSPLVWKKSEVTTVLVMNNLNWALLSLVKNKWMKILLTILKNNRVLFLTVLTLF